MATRSRPAMQNGKSPKESNVWQRVVELPVVRSVSTSLRKTYRATKEVHPLVASACGAYEKGVRRASSVAAWSVGPVVRTLEPQLATANRLACQGLDRLEQKMPALHQPVQKVTADLKASVFTRLQNATHALVAFWSNLWGVASESCAPSENRVKGTMGHVRRSPVSVAAEAGLDATMGKLENVIDFFLQKAEEQSAPGSIGSSKEESPTSLFGKVGAFAAGIFQWISERASHALQQAKDMGRDMAVWIPGLTTQGPEQQPLLRGLAQNLRTAYLSTLLLAKNAPSLAWSAAGQLFQVSSVREAGGKRGIFPSIMGRLLGTIAHYIPLPEATERDASTPVLRVDCAESTREQETDRSEAVLELEGGGLGQTRDARRLSRGHYPLPFLNLDDPLPLPYKEGAGRRRWSEGLFWISPEVAQLRARSTALQGAAFKKD